MVHCQGIGFSVRKGKE